VLEKSVKKSQAVKSAQRIRLEPYTLKKIGIRVKEELEK
jgi:hypothetical protein